MLAATRLAAADVAPLSLSIDFIKGITVGLVESRGRIVSASRSTQFIHVETGQAGVCCATSSIVFAKRRVTDRIDSATMPRCAPPESLQTIAIDGGPVTWIKQYDMRPALGNLRQRSPQMRSLTWVRLSNDRNLSFVTLTALSDASFPRIFYHYDAPSPIATVTMSVHFHAAAADLAAIGGDFVLIEASNQLARDGFFDQHVRVWSRGGDLLATSTQLVWFDVSNPS